MRIAIVLAAAAVVAPAGGAFAHARLVKAEPAVGSTVSAGPARLRLKFNEPIRPAASGVRLTGPDGKGVVLSPLSKDARDPKVVSAPAPPNLAPGRYKVEWKALSPDGHHTQGDYGFTIRP